MYFVTCNAGEVNVSEFKDRDHAFESRQCQLYTSQETMVLNT